LSKGEVRASIVTIAEGAQMEGDVVAEELTIGGHVKGTIHANRVRLSSTAVVEGHIFHRTLAIEENARFEGTSRRQENTVDTPSRVLPNRPHPQAVSIDGNGKANGSSDGVNP
jgi:cytoskeletal protein CcmA (bactofilin family)